MLAENKRRDDEQTGIRAGWIPILCLIILVGLLIALDRPLIRGDGVAYLAWVDTMVLDRDIQFDNQLEILAPVNSYQLTWNDATGRLVNIFPFGVAILQAPFYTVGAWFAANGWLQHNAAYFAQMQGVSLAHSAWLMIGANVMALLTAILGWCLARRALSNGLAAVTALAFFVGTPLIYYSTVSPLNSHLAGALLTSAFVALLLELERRPTRWWLSIALGICAGLMVLVRWQLFLVAAPAWLFFWWPAGGIPRRWPELKRAVAYGLPPAALAAGAAAATLLPLPLAWQTMFGEPFVIPYNEVGSGSFLSWPRYAGDVLRLLLLHSPIIGLALVGIPFLWRRSRRWGAYAALVIGLQIWLNGGVLDWWAGETYGMRRMSELYPLYVLLGSAALAQLWSPSAATPIGRWRRRLAWAVPIVALLAAGAYLIVFIDYTWTNSAQEFINDPAIMVRHFWAKPDRWRIVWAVYRSHLGPLAWGMPGP